MTRGRRPLLALKEAYEIAAKRGQVLPAFDGRYDNFHFILFTSDNVTFIKVKRTLTNKSDPVEILNNYARDIRHIAQVPETDVAVREFWTRSPRGDFHFFRVGKDRVLGLAGDGSVIPGADYPLDLQTVQELPKVTDTVQAVPGKSAS